MKKFKQYFLSSMILYVFFYLNEILCNYWVTLSEINSYNNTPYNKNAVIFIISSSNSASIDFSELEQSDYLSGCVILRFNDGNYKLNEVIYCADNVIKINGLNELDFNSQKKSAAAGIDSGYSIGGSITQYGNNYLICGILDRHVSAAVNTGIFYSNNNLSHVPTECTYVLTSKDKTQIDHAYAKIEKIAESKNIQLKKINIRNAGFSDYINYGEITKIILILLIVFYIIFIYLFRYFWIKVNKPKIFIYNILGVSNIKIRLQAEYFLIWGVSYISSIMTFFIFNKNQSNNCSAVLIFTFCIFIIAIISSINMIKIAK